LSNLATFVGLWMNYLTSPESVQQKVAHLLIIIGATVSVVLYALILYRIIHKTQATVAHEEETALEQFRNPQWETMIGKSFKNEEVILDKKRFWNCTFDNVTLRFKGEGPVEFMHGCNFAPNMILASNSPVAMEYAKLIEIFGSLPNTQTRHVSVDKDGKPLAPTFHITELRKNRRAEDRPQN
jgi:hypothetical protein